MDMKRTPLKRRSKTPRAKLTEALWQLCREITFKKYGDVCYTCGSAPLIGSNRQCGHFIPSSICSTEMRYDLENLKPQCMPCNIHKSGNWPAYEAHLLKDGVDIDELKARNRRTQGQKYSTVWLQNRIDTYELIAGAL